MELRSICELDELEQIESVAARYLAMFGSEPLNVSHWDPSTEFKDAAAAALEFERAGDTVREC